MIHSVTAARGAPAQSTGALGQSGTLVGLELVLQYFDGCPNWWLADQRLRSALHHVEESSRVVVYQLIRTPQEAQAVGFRGSPTVLVDGIDPFADPVTPVGLSCRLYRTPVGVEGAPTVDQLVDAIRRVERLRADGTEATPRTLR